MRDDPSYQLNTPMMHANLHTEFIHSVSFLMSEDLNAHLFCGVTRNQHWHEHIEGKLDASQIAQLKCLIGSGLFCNYESWLEKSMNEEIANIFNPNNTRENTLCCSDNVNESMRDATYVSSHSKPCLFVSNAMFVVLTIFLIHTCDNIFCQITGADSFVCCYLLFVWDIFNGVYIWYFFGTFYMSVVQ